jgi:iron(III) transport system permease protein
VDAFLSRRPPEPARPAWGLGAAGRAWDPQGLLVLALLLLLAGGVLSPLLRVLAAAVWDESGLTLRHLAAFAARPLLVESLLNTLLAGALVVFFGSLIGVPLACLTARYAFRGKGVLDTLAVLPLAIPPFVGALAFQHVLGPGGTRGLAGVVLVQTAHSFPLIMLNTAWALAGMDPALAEAARNLGASRLGVFRRVLLPLALPGLAAGACLTFIRVLDDLGTPLVLGYTRLLAPQAYLGVTTAGFADADTQVICAVLLALSALAFRGARAALSPGEHAVPAPPSPLSGARALAAWAVGLGLLGPALLPQLGILLLSLSEGGGLGNYAAILVHTPGFLLNTLRYALLAAGLDVLLGAVIAWLLLRGRVRGRGWPAAVAHVPLAVPGVVLAVGYLRIFDGWDVPGLGQPLTATWLVLVLAYAMRRLPYTVRAAEAALRPLPAALGEAARGLGANRLRSLLRVTAPLVAGGLLAGGLVAFVTASVELSSTLLLVPRAALGPLSYGIYVSAQSAEGRGPAAAMGVVAILLAGAGTWLAHRLGARGRPGFLWRL